MVWVAVIALVIGVQIMVVLFVVHRNKSSSPAAGDGPGVSVTTSGPGGGGSGPIADDAIPGVGGDVFLAGGLARVPVPEGWRLLARGDRRDNPGGYSESAVLVNPQSAIAIGVYLRADAINPADAVAAADAEVRSWVRDGQEAQFQAAQALPTGGSVAGAASARYRFVRGSQIDGEVLVAVRGDGATLVVFVDAPAGSLDAASSVWGPVREALVSDFAA